MKHGIKILITLVMLFSITQSSFAQPNVPARAVPASVSDLKLASPIEAEGASPRLDASLVGATGPQQVIVRLSTMAVGELATSTNTILDQSSQGLKTQLQKVKTQQAKISSYAKGLDANVKVLGTTQRVRNLLLLEIDGAKLAKLAANPEVLSIRPVVNYELDLANAVPYVGGTAVHNDGITGAGVTIAMIDTGIDYNHSLLGGSGIVADYTNNDPNVIEPGTFPTAKVIGGTDFVGSNWPNTGLEPDLDPLDKGASSGHGTHTASIAGGLSGMAPDAKLYALKVCSSVSTSCSGVAMFQALDWITDPNGDGDLSDHADVANMSIGSPYGQPHDDDASLATEIAVQVGVLVVTSTGNSADKPYIGGTPGATLSALAVGATENPVSVMPVLAILSPAIIAGNVGAAYQSWSAPLTSAIEAEVGYFATPTAKRIGCNADNSSPYAAGEFAGKIALVDRGTCAISYKVSNAAAAGAVAVVVGLVAPGDPTTFSYGGGTPSVPAYNITQADASKIKAQIAAPVVVRIDPANTVPLAGTVIGFSSRGPSASNMIKPEIAAPGDLVAAAMGTGTGLVQMAGTSMASPMVAGAGALLKQAQPTLSARQLKAVLVENSETNVMNKAAVMGGRLAPIARVGGGELRIDRAVAAKAVAMEVNTLQPVLSFGLKDVDASITTTKAFKITNLTNTTHTYKITSTFRFPEDEASGAVTIKVNPGTMKVAPHATSAAIIVTMKIDPTKLSDWTLNSGDQGASGDTLTANEYDGYVWMDDINTTADDTQMLHMPWMVLPRLSDKVKLGTNLIGQTGGYLLRNLGAGPAYIDTFALQATSPALPKAARGANLSVVDLRFVGDTTYPVPAGFCSADPSFVLAVQITTWERQAHLDAPAEFDVYFDTNQDGTADYLAYNFDVSNSTTFDGRNATHVVNLTTGIRSVFFYTDHATNSVNTTLLMCGEQIGMNAANFGQMMNVDVYAFDWYSSGLLTDAVEGLTFAPGGERYVAQFGASDFYSTDMAPSSATIMSVIDLGSASTNPAELGLLLINTGTRGSFKSGAGVGNEAVPFFVKP